MIDIDRIICGDNVAVMSTFPDACIDLVVTSPPYDNLRTYGGHTWDFEGVAAQLVRVIKPGGVIVWVVADATIDGSETGTSMRQALRFMELGLRLHDTMIYRKTNGGANGSMKAYLACWEYMFVLSKGEPSAMNFIRDRKNEMPASEKEESPGRREVDGEKKKRHVIKRFEFGRRFNVWDYAVGGGCVSEDKATFGHPAVFPEQLASDHIKSWSNEGDLVLDPFAGSFTTCKAAKILQRRWIGIEVNPEYCEIGRKRMAQGVLAFGG